MSQILESCRKSGRFDQVDILSRLEETVCLPPLEIQSPIHREIERALPVDEEPERWDGLS
ncbi:MAG TPA: hypothetical protein VH475_04080 [Tepidisphaeraceae bacterium]